MPALFPQTIQLNPTAVLDETTGTTPADLVTGAVNGTKVFAIHAYNDDSSAHDVLLSLDDGSNEVILGKVNVPAGGSAAIINETDLPGLVADRSILVGPAAVLKVATAALPGAGKTVQIMAEAADY